VAIVWPLHSGVPLRGWSADAEAVCRSRSMTRADGSSASAGDSTGDGVGRACGGSCSRYRGAPSRERPQVSLFEVDASR